MKIKFDEGSERSSLDGFDSQRPSPLFIGEAKFPFFKNVERNTVVTFDWPITALVGANGTGKSSILHALWGMPQGYSTSRFWFSTAVDRIRVSRASGVPRYWYKHWIPELKRYVESKKVFGRKRMGYWEPARALKSDGMSPMPAWSQKDEPFRSRDRWNQCKRSVVYMNFKCELSAFERFFYFDDGQSLADKQLNYLKGARRLMRVITGGRQSYSPGGKQAVFENRMLNENEIAWVSYILGREYISARYVRHRLLTGVESPTVLFQRPDLAYSEAAAGSGELAITRAVIQLLKAPEHSLILLDEPETSLHPGAQTAFTHFLFRLARTKRMQIIMSTHSPTIVEMLPAKAIKILEETQEGRSRITSVSHPAMAFNRLGYVDASKIHIAIEDDLLKALVELATLQLDPGERDMLVLYTPPGGASSIICHGISVWMNTSHNFYAILDGDQRPQENLKPIADMSQRELQVLPTQIAKIFGSKPDHVDDLVQSKKYWEWARVRLRFLNEICPEAVLLKALRAAEPFPVANQEAKARFIKAMEEEGHKTDAASLAASVSFIIGNKGAENQTIINLAEDLRAFIAHHESLRSSK